MNATSTLKVRVARKYLEAQDICSLELVPIAGQTLPRFEAGSHIDIYLKDGVVRQYSLCNDPKETNRYLIAVLRDPSSRGGSKAVHDSISEGETVVISEPRNNFRLAAEATEHLLLAGGIGITPILCMAESLTAVDAKFDMVYASRSRQRTAFLDRIGSSRFNERVKIYFDDEPDCSTLDLTATLACVSPGKHLYVCGPKGFMDAVLNCARAAGWAEKNLHWEFFASAGATARDSDESFEIQLASSGRVIIVPREKTAAQALIEAGVQLPVSCEQGVCGTCLTGVLQGIPDHRDLYLTPDEQTANTHFTPCCSRSQTPRLVIDI